MTRAILFVSSYTGLGGGESWLLTLARHLDPTRFIPHLLVPAEGDLARLWRDGGWPVHITPWRGATTYFVPQIWARFPISRRIEQLIRDHHIQLVHSDYHTLPMAQPAGERAGVPVMWTCMGWWFKPKFWQRGFFRRSRATFAHSQAIKDGFLGQSPFMPPEQVEVLYPGVDTARFHPDVDGLRVRFEANIMRDLPIVGLVARFQDVKGHDVFQAVARQVALQIREARFIVAGENTQSSADNSYKQRILDGLENDPILRKRMVYLGFREDVERVIAPADVMVCTSRFESYGIANVEAMAVGKPVVSSNRGGPSETIVHDETGYLVEPLNVQAFARHIITLLRDPDLRATMGTAGRARVEQYFSATSNAAQFTRTLERLLPD